MWAKTHYQTAAIRHLCSGDIWWVNNELLHFSPKTVFAIFDHFPSIFLGKISIGTDSSLSDAHFGTKKSTVPHIVKELQH